MSRGIYVCTDSDAVRCQTNSLVQFGSVRIPEDLAIRFALIQRYVCKGRELADFLYLSACGS